MVPAWSRTCDLLAMMPKSAARSGLKAAPHVFTHSTQVTYVLKRYEGVFFVFCTHSAAPAHY